MAVLSLFSILTRPLKDFLKNQTFPKNFVESIMKTITILILGLVVYVNAGLSAYGPVYTPIIKAEYPTYQYAVHSPIIAAPGYGESLIKHVAVPAITEYVEPAIKTIEYGHDSYDISYGTLLDHHHHAY